LQFFLNGKSRGSAATLWFAVVYILAMRNNPLLIALFGLSFERVLSFHRIIGRFAIIMGFIHFLSYRNESWFKGLTNISGSLALIVSLLIGATSLNIFRRKMYQVFITFHWVLFILLIIFCLIHGAGVIMLGAIGVIIDLIFRWYSIYYKPVSMKDIQLLDGNVIKIEFNKKDFQYNAGQYVNICIPCISWVESHPFTISSSPSCDDTITIHIRVLGDWTRKLETLIAK